MKYIFLIIAIISHFSIHSSPILDVAALLDEISKEGFSHVNPPSSIFVEGGSEGWFFDKAEELISLKRDAASGSSRTFLSPYATFVLDESNSSSALGGALQHLVCGSQDTYYVSLFLVSERYPLTVVRPLTSLEKKDGSLIKSLYSRISSLEHSLLTLQEQSERSKAKAKKEMGSLRSTRF